MVFANIVAWLDVTPDWLFLYLKRENNEWCEDPNLILKDPIISESCIEIKIELNFYFHTSL